MNIAFFGSSLVSAYWNGAATYYRGILRAMHERGHVITFYESDAYERQKHRDIDDPPYARVVVYSHKSTDELRRCLDEARSADFIVKASGNGVFDELLEAEVAALKSPRNLVAFWDVDAPVTLERTNANPSDPWRSLASQYDIILTYGGGEPVVNAYRQLGAKQCVPIYNALDPTTHFPVPAESRFRADLNLLANRLPDREARVEEFFLRAAEQLPGRQFIIGGSGWADKRMSVNVRHVGHVYTADHNAFNCSPLAVLNVNRDSMARFGFSPATRVFEAAGAGACLITDEFVGVETFFEPGSEILVARDGDDVAEHVRRLTEARSREIGQAAYRRALAEHTYAHRAEKLDELLGANTQATAAPAGAHSLHSKFEVRSSTFEVRLPQFENVASANAELRTSNFELRTEGTKTETTAGRGPTLRVVIIGLSITSSWGNGHATTYRGLVRELVKRNHDVLFLEHDKPWYASNRDLPNPPFGRTELYVDLEGLKSRFAAEVREADVVIVGSYVPQGVEVGEWVTRTATGLTAFYDIDTPVTLAKLARGDFEYLSPGLIPKFQLYLSFTGGPTLQRLEREFGSPRALPLYCSVDPELYFEPAEPVQHSYALAYLGTYSPDRQPTLDQLLIQPARQLPHQRFAVAGPQYPADIPWPANVVRVEHLPPSLHRGFYSSQRFTLNVTRADMIRAGWSPSVRLFEAAACGTPIITDEWEGLDDFFIDGKEIIVARSGREVVAALADMNEAERVALGAAAREAVLSRHTAAHRAAELEQYILDAPFPRQPAAGGMGRASAASYRDLEGALR